MASLMRRAAELASHASQLYTSASARLAAASQHLHEGDRVAAEEAMFEYRVLLAKHGRATDELIDVQGRMQQLRRRRS